MMHTQSSLNHASGNPRTPLVPRLHQAACMPVFEQCKHVSFHAHGNNQAEQFLSILLPKNLHMNIRMAGLARTDYSAYAVKQNFENLLGEFFVYHFICIHNWSTQD